MLNAGHRWECRRMEGVNVGVLDSSGLELTLLRYQRHARKRRRTKRSVEAASGENRSQAPHDKRVENQRGPQEALRAYDR